MSGKDIDSGFHIPPSKLRSPTQNDRVGLLLHLAPRSCSACNRSLTPCPPACPASCGLPVLP